MNVSKSLYLVPLLLGLSIPGAALAGKKVSVGLNFGETTSLVKSGSLELRAQCVLNEGGDDVIRVFAVTTEAGSYLEGADELEGDGDYLTPATPAADAELLREDVSTGDESFDNDSDEGWVFAPSGTFISVIGDEALLAVNPAGSVFDCLVSAVFETGKRSFKAATPLVP